MALERGPLLADDSLTGAAWCRAHTQLVDAWLADLLESAAGGAAERLALVAVGGFGRAELCPQSDIDVMLVHDRRTGVGPVAERLWYPVWDTGLHLGHSVCTLREALQLAATDLDTATALLSARYLAGDQALAGDLAEAGLTQWKRRARHWLEELAARVEQRHVTSGEVAFRMEPDLKDGRGGLRDVHSLRWAEAAGSMLLERDDASLAAAYSVLLDARVELQRVTDKPTNQLTLSEQDTVARRLGLDDADALMARIAEAARSIAWTSDDTWRRIRSGLRGPVGRVARRSREVSPGVELREGEVRLAGGARSDPMLALRLAVAAARNEAAVERQSLELLAAEMEPMPDPWPDRARDVLVDLLLSGAPAVPVVEAYDQRGIWTRILPEWAPVRNLPQRSSYHRFTVDRHLLETAANAARLVDRVTRPDLLVVAALLHGLDKGYDSDDAAVGRQLVTAVTRRLGYPADDTAVVALLVENHRLLSDVATRRDLNEQATIERVAATVGTAERLALLAALTEADARATGPWAWGPWKADLVGQLVARVAQVLEGADPRAMERQGWPDARHLEWLASGEQRIEARDDVLTVVTEDRAGVFSRIAGVLALHGLDVLTAAAYSSDDGRAVSEFRVADRFRDETPWAKVVQDLERALDGRLALQARVAERARTYARPERARPSRPVRVDVHNDVSPTATVVDVQTTDGVGVLYRITRALAELDLDIRFAKVETLADQVVDAFYVRDRRGDKITDPTTLAEIERAILHGLA